MTNGQRRRSKTTGWDYAIVIILVGLFLMALALAFDIFQ